MASKTLTGKQAAGKSLDTEQLQRRYDRYMEHVNSGMESNVYQMGDILAKRHFIEQVLSAGIVGKKLSVETGRSHIVPDLYENGQGHIGVDFVDYEPTKSLSQNRVNRIQKAEMMQASVLNMDSEIDGIEDLDLQIH